MTDDLEVLRTREGFFPSEPLFPTGGIFSESKPNILGPAPVPSTTSKTCPKCGSTDISTASYQAHRDVLVRKCGTCSAQWDELPLDKKLNPKPAGLGGEKLWNQIVSGIRQALGWLRGQRK